MDSLKSSGRRALAWVVAVLATTAIGWNHEYSWYDAAAPTAAGKPGAGGIFGTGGFSEGGIQCAHCHLPVPNSPIRVSVTFSPQLGSATIPDGGVNSGQHTLGRYDAGQAYSVNVRLLNEQFPGNGNGNNFAATFEDGTGNRVGLLRSDGASPASLANCPSRPAPGAAPSNITTYMHTRCDLIFSAYPSATLTSWNFTWVAPTDAGVGPVTMALGLVDGNGDDRYRFKDGGPNDAVVMTRFVLNP